MDYSDLPPPSTGPLMSVDGTVVLNFSKFYYLTEIIQHQPTLYECLMEIKLSSTIRSQQCDDVFNGYVDQCLMDMLKLFGL